MLAKWLWRLVRYARLIWVRTTLIAVLAILTVAFAELIPSRWAAGLSGRFGSDALVPVLNVLASSMLAVTTFSLSVMVAAHRSASSQVTPRAHRLLLEDPTTGNTLATFLGAFVFSLSGLILLHTGLVSPGTAVVLFFVTLAVTVLVVTAILRWIDRLSRLGSVIETTRAVEQAARDALCLRAERPALGAVPASGDGLPGGFRVPATATGYIQHVDIGALNRAATQEGTRVHLLHLPGSFVTEGQPLLACDPVPDRAAKAMTGAITVGDVRSYDQDPRFGLIVLSEIASRALSPAMNDPGTAIDVIGRLQRLLSSFRETRQEPPAAKNVIAPTLAPADLLADAYGPIARDGAGMMEVQMRLQKALAMLALHPDPAMRDAAVALSARALAQSDRALPLADDREALLRLAPASGAAPT